MGYSIIPGGVTCIIEIYHWSNICFCVMTFSCFLHLHITPFGIKKNWCEFEWSYAISSNINGIMILINDFLPMYLSMCLIRSFRSMYQSAVFNFSTTFVCGPWLHSINMSSAQPLWLLTWSGVVIPWMSEWGNPNWDASPVHRVTRWPDSCAKRMMMSSARRDQIQ